MKAKNQEESLSELDEILENFAASISPVVVMGAPNKNPYLKPQHLKPAKQALTTLISKREVEARIDEIERVYGKPESHWSDSPKLMSVSRREVYDRLAALKQQNGGV